MNKSFLEYVAEDILGKYGTDLSRVAVVFPNKRASLFLNDHLASLTDAPLWSPSYITISELFRQHAPCEIADPIKLICDLHKSFTQVSGIDETLDHFYGWGQVLLSDFDDVDKSMADADKVFAHLSNLHEYDSTDYLTTEQQDIIRHFFSHFSPDHNTILKERFLRLWSKMGDIYHDFNRRLREQRLAYEGALCRDVAERADTIDFSRYDHYLFVGFNLLQATEQRLFAALRRQGRAHFYWDYDHSYMADHEAGRFIARYLTDFPNELSADDDRLYRCMARPKTLTVVEAPTENIQARYAADWLREGRRIADGRQTAIVMCDEKLLSSLVHCLPDEVEKVNVTTGYPLAQTPAASLIGQLIALRTAGYDHRRGRYRLRYVNALLSHPYVSRLSPDAPQLCQTLNERKDYYPDTQTLSADEGLALLFKPLQGLFYNQELLTWLCQVVETIAQHGAADNPFFQESVFRTYSLLNRLQTLVGEGDLTVDTPTLQRLIVQLVQQTSVPFHGEPAEGVQLMGVLETRNIDFSHLLILSCNEGNMPRGLADPSVIPHSLRRAYALTTTDHKEAVYSYHFHRLLQRADDVTMVYNSSTTDGQRGEMSRFMLQLMVAGNHPVGRLSLRAPQAHTPFRPPTFNKDEAAMQALRRRFALSAAASQHSGPLLTPTAINRYQRCPLQFYYRYVKNLNDQTTNPLDDQDNRLFGNIFHEAARLLYTRLAEKSPTIAPHDLEQLLKTRVDIEQAVDHAFLTELFHADQQPSRQRLELSGLQLINREVIIRYLRQLVDIDRRLAPFTIIGLEEEVVEPLQTPHLTTTIGGRIDRLDRIGTDSGERIRVVDYKTGSRGLQTPPADIDAIFCADSPADHRDYYLQTLLYAAIVSRRQTTPLPVAPALLFIQHASGEAVDPTLPLGSQPITDVAAVSDTFYAQLTAKVDEMFDPAVPFTPTTDRDHCLTCPYYNLCR